MKGHNLQSIEIVNKNYMSLLIAIWAIKGMMILKIMILIILEIKDNKPLIIIKEAKEHLLRFLRIDPVLIEREVILLWDKEIAFNSNL